MISRIYEWLALIGYSHPLHPPVIHLPVGLVTAACIFLLVSRITRKDAVARTALHCVILALLTIPAAAVTGVMDWQHLYGGSWILPIRIKMGLAFLLSILLMLAWRTSPKAGLADGKAATLYVLCLVTVFGLGYAGGELVYGSRSPAAGLEDSEAHQGAVLFASQCAGCHHTDSTRDKFGPGLKGLFRRDRLPVSQRPVSETSVMDQLRHPFDRMPSYPELSEDEVQSLIVFMKTL